MKLKFRIETRKIKQPRIVVLRLLQKNDKIVEKSLGSFSSKRGYDHIIKQLTPDELYEFENFTNVINFAKNNFNCNADKVDRFIIKTAPDFKNALFKIWEKAKEYNIEFIPEYEMLLSVFSKAKSIEQELSILTNGEFKALASINIDINDVNVPKRNLKEDQKLFAAVMENTQSREELAEIFNKIALEKYQKAPKFKPHHFDYLKEQVEQGKKQPFPKWYFTVTLDVLLQLDIDPSKIISPALLTEHWLRLNKQDNLSKTQNAFNHQFKILKNNQTCHNIIQLSFIKDELARLYQKIKTLPVPSTAAEKWIHLWKEKHPNGTRENAIMSFNKEFPLLADNQFFIKIINAAF